MRSDWCKGITCASATSCGSFVVMHAAHQLSREFIGCDKSYSEGEFDRFSIARELA
jgi:hypothetical protein